LLLVRLRQLLPAECGGQLLVLVLWQLRLTSVCGGHLLLSVEQRPAPS
jgi:hypothetical protein